MILLCKHTKLVMWPQVCIYMACASAQDKALMLNDFRPWLPWEAQLCDKATFLHIQAYKLAVLPSHRE